MAREVTRNSPVYWNNRKIGNAQQSSYEENGNVSQGLVADGIVLAFGPVLTTLKIDLMSPVGGPKVRVRPQEQGKLQILVEGQLHNIEAVCASKSQDSE